MAEKGEKGKEKRKKKRKQKREQKVEERETVVLPRRHAHLSMVNEHGEEFTGQVMQNTVHHGEKIVWIKLHEGNVQQPIALNKLRSWTYMSEAHAKKRKEVLKMWEEFEERSGRQTNAQQAARELQERWEQHESRYQNRCNPRNPQGLEVMSQPILRTRRLL